MIKYYVLDTNVLLHSPYAITAFNEHMVIIPEVVLEELDRFKSETSERGANSRLVSRMIDKFRIEGNLLTGVSLNNQGGLVRIEANHLDTHMPPHWDKLKADNRILQVCKGLAEDNLPTVLVSRDTNMRVKAAILGIQAEDFRNEKVASVEEQYTGRAIVYTASNIIDAFHQDDGNYLDPSVLQVFDEATHTMLPIELVTNQFLLIRSTDNDRHTALGRFDGQKIVHLKYRSRNPFGVSPRNVGQVFMQECLMLSAEEAPLVIIKGPAGTAKTFYSLAVGLYNHLDCRPRAYHHVLICRPNVPMDEDLGFLPGSEQDKIDPYMRAIRDNLFTLMSSHNMTEPKEIEQAEDTVQMLFDKHIIQTEALAYQRGRSLQKYWIILDEMQNSTPRQAKGVITRPGLGTKIILLGDPEQIDHPFLDSRTNGLVYAAEKMKGSKLCFQVTLDHDECERSPLAAEASLRL
ncbi:PhoH family protein [Sporomusa sphaeroides]|uniref:PhoH-like protein n=2 Tax=Sporomusa TaxID=2375 RepID=A0ABM9W281_9FIRM|nr:PhoH family protein [Sporomusa sphaeroides]OLS56070.1 PhoH-like protein [Sporomusa sphaeroides DSM 2875]CVK19288.1 PhoH-like protein [Sporomusa sphaeroides DSM 2875]SCM82681.1 PhoH family protein [uncultured Sporomusa sp.]